VRASWVGIALRVEHSHRFAVPVADGFAFITDLRNWPAYWPDLVRVEPGSRWSAPGDRAVVVQRLLGREVRLQMTLSRLEPERLVAYASVQRGLPDARHERHFAPAGDGFDYRLVVDLEPRGGLRGVLDRVLVRRAVARALRRTAANLEACLGEP
jgi:Polyketide cyclase / dehydrase and lipid transport